MTYDFMERLTGIATTEIKYSDVRRFVGHVAASQIVAAEIIANAIKEAAPRKSDAAYNITVGNPQSLINPERLAGEIRKLLEESERFVQNPTQ